MLIQTDSQALTILNDLQENFLRREEAAHYLVSHPSEQAIEYLVKSLEDNNPGLRWVSAEALAMLGEVALPQLLKALTHHAGPLLREGAYHILNTNQSFQVRSKANRLLAALKGLGAGVSAPAAAFDWLQELKQAQPPQRDYLRQSMDMARVEAWSRMVHDLKGRIY